VFASVALLAATSAGRVGEAGGVWLVAPELLPAPRPVIPCAGDLRPSSSAISFGMLQPGEPDNLPRMLASGARTGVAFEWHADTGELTLGGTGGAMFSDLESVSTRNVSLVTPNCGSR
jgi:hypothetical protein